MHLAIGVVVRPRKPAVADPIPEPSKAGCVLEPHEREPPVVGRITLYLDIKLRTATAAASLSQRHAAGETYDEPGSKYASAEPNIHFFPSSSLICLLFSARSVSSFSSSDA